MIKRYKRIKPTLFILILVVGPQYDSCTYIVDKFYSRKMAEKQMAIFEKVGTVDHSYYIEPV